MVRRIANWLCIATLCLFAAGCTTAAVETVEMPATSMASYRAVVVSVPLERGVDKDLARVVEAEAVQAIKRSRRWRLVVAQSLAAGQREGLRVEIDLRQKEASTFKSFTNTSSATVTLWDISNGQRLGGVSVSASGASMEMTAQALGQETADWLVKLP